jgi:DNA-binding transcriptional ArsR family regulator
MGWWQVNADTLAESRFVISPLAEATASLIALERGTATHPGERTWLDVHKPAYRELLASDPVTALLVRAALGHHWIADLFTIAPTGEGEPTLDEDLARVRERLPEIARRDLTMSLGGPLPASLERSDLPERASDLLKWVWTESVLPYWPRRRRILEADIVARTRQLSQGGWAAALEDMSPGMRWLGESRLQINAHNYPPRKIAGAQLLFVPVTPGQGWVSWDGPHRYAVFYQCSGVLAQGDPVPVPQALGVLLGRARAGVLISLETPKSTTQLVALTGQGLGSVGRHLKVLLDAGLVQRRRAGRSVLYYRTAAGETLLAAQQS